MLTIKLNKLGYFNWISTTPQIKNIALVIGLLAILYTIFTALMIKADWATYPNQSISNPLDFLAYTSYIWVPLLMIIPYGLFVFSCDELISQSYMVKVPLIIHVLLGAGIFMYFNLGFVKVVFSKRESEQDYAIHQTIVKIQNESKIMDVLYYTRPGNDSKVVDAALAKIKADPAWEYQLIEALENCGNDDSFLEIYHFLSVHKVDHPDKFLVPFARSITCVAVLSSKIADNEYTSPNDLDMLNIEKMLSSISYQFHNPSKEILERLTLLEGTLEAITREDFKNKTQELIKVIEIFKEQY
jgi:hypothetical protein